MPPVVAILGRPNVGKSTLFNRLTATRAALVSDMPGLTRDRREGEAVLGGHRVTLIDTAGLEDAAAGSIPARMRAQSEAALAQADLVLFVLDARAGVVPADAAFARVVRASGKPVILVANKSEGRAAADGFYEAFQLGLGDPVPVSAEHGEGIGELVAAMLAGLGLKAVTRRRRDEDDVEPAATGELQPDDTSRPIRVAIVGRPNAGKSTLVNALLGEERMLTGPEPGLTRDAVASDFMWGQRRVRLFDTAGLRRKARITEKAEKLSASDAVRAIRFAEVVVLLIDAERDLEHQDLTIADLVEQEGRALVVAINKWDVVADKQKRLKDLRDALGERLAQMPDVPLVAVSALAGRGLDKLEAAVFATYERWNRRVPTGALNRWLNEALDRHTAPAAKGRRIKIRFMTQPSSRPPTFVAFCSQPEALPKAYLRYLTNSLRQTFDLPGVPIRLRLRKGDNPFAKD
jgi:GTP-binding protein